MVKSQGLTTVCQEAQCPNQFECFSKGTATFMILGDKCSRNCHFCAVGQYPQGPPDPKEPMRVAQAIKTLNLRYVVITSVTRDDLEDGGAHIFSQTIREIRKIQPESRIEVLIPDLMGNWQALKGLLDAGPDVLNHNIETVQRLYGPVRPQAIYERSLELLRQVKSVDGEIPTKSGIMLGLGESRKELLKTFQDIRDAGCDLLSMGQYLQPTKKHLSVERFVSPDEFGVLKEKALAMGFVGVAAGPTVRSSYDAERLYQDYLQGRRLV